RSIFDGDEAVFRRLHRVARSALQLGLSYMLFNGHYLAFSITRRKVFGSEGSLILDGEEIVRCVQVE
ncbi:MAG: hypothetical protein M3R61_06010, partial [Chloroflexota bacterium]|nr:hypothetical protein [Chloroflexota bacterium]